GDRALRLENVAFLQPLVVPEGGRRTTQLVLRSAGADAFEFQVFAAPPDEGNAGWILHATGTIRAETEAPAAAAPAPAGPADVADRCRDRRPGDVLFYDPAREGGLALGPTFRWATTVALGDEESLAEMAPAAPLHEGDAYLLHPGLIDSCAGLLHALIPDSAKP